ncbi:MAG: xanthine dehydrogenase family protein subunit M [Sneathiellaceae bacterium]
MIPGPFEYHRPSRLEEAVAILGAHGDDALVLAGGHSLIPMMKLRMAVPEHLVDLQALADLRFIRQAGDMLEIGAMTTQAEVLASDLVAQACPILQEAGALIADPQVRARGTIGGNVANGDPGNDMPAVMLALDARFALAGPDGERELPARGFYQSSYVTARQDAEILTAIRIPLPPMAAGEARGWAYEKQKRKVGDYATAAAAVVLTMSGGTCRSVSIGLTNLAPGPLLAADAATALVGSSLDKAALDEAVAAARAITEPSSDGRGPADYRTHLAGVMLRRAVLRAAQRAS